ARRSSVAATSAPCSPKSTHWPCAVYAQTQTSVATPSSGTASFTAWIARGTTWSGSLASIACSSLRSLMPNRRRPARPADAADRASRTTSVTERRSSHGAPSTFSRSSIALPTMTGRMRRPARSAFASARDQTGCSASLPRASVAAAPAPEPKAAPTTAAFSEMKHVWQSLNNCGPASVVMALSTFGIDVSQEFARVPLRGTNILSGMGPQKVDGWVNANFGLRSVWRNNGTNDLVRRLVANGFAPMVTQWMQDPSISRIAHWRVVRGYDDAASVFYVNDPMLGNMVPLSYEWFQNNWQSFSYRYMVIYDPTDEALLKAIIGDDWNDTHIRK